MATSTLITSENAVKSGFSALSEDERQAALSFLLVSDNDIVLDGAWEDRNEKDRLNDVFNNRSSIRFSPTNSSPSPSSSSSNESSRSPSPFSTTSNNNNKSLLIRSKCQGWERSFELHQDWPKPEIEKDDEILIEHVCIGLNPVDYKSILFNFGIPKSPWVLGRDIFGIIKEVGKNCSNELLKPGKRVWLCADQRDLRSGAYQAFSVSKSNHIGLVPDNVNNQQAATLGTGLITAAISAFWFFRWPRSRLLGIDKVEAVSVSENAGISNEPSFQPSPTNKPWILIYGGGAITGIFMAQLARLSGLRIISIASPSNFNYLQSKEIGVDHCIDRFLSLDQIANQVHSLVNNDGGLQFVVDTVGSQSSEFCYKLAKSLGTSSSCFEIPSQIICLAGNPKKFSEEGNRQVILHKISFSTTFYGDDIFSKNILKDLTELMIQKELHPVKYEIIPDGLAGIRKGLERLRDNQVPRAHKLIVNLADTPHAHMTNLGVRAELGWNGVA